MSDGQPLSTERLVASALMALLGIALTLFLAWLYQLATYPSYVNWQQVGSAGGAVVFGLVIAGWRFPKECFAIFRAPLTLAQRQGLSASKRLRTPIQRVMFLLSLVVLAPWLVFRAIPEFWRSAGLDEYVRHVFLAPIVGPFTDSWRWTVEWFDYGFLPAIVLTALAFSWPHTGARLSRWIKEGR
jgi:hypothetical protein